MVFFITDVSIGFLCSYLANCREALDWHIFCQPDAYWVPTLQDDLKDGKIKSVEICDKSFDQTDSALIMTDSKMKPRRASKGVDASINTRAEKFMRETKSPGGERERHLGPQLQPTSRLGCP